MLDLPETPDEPRQIHPRDLRVRWMIRHFEVARCEEREVSRMDKQIRLVIMHGRRYITSRASAERRQVFAVARQQREPVGLRHTGITGEL